MHSGVFCFFRDVMIRLHGRDKHTGTIHIYNNVPERASGKPAPAFRVPPVQRIISMNVLMCISTWASHEHSGTQALHQRRWRGRGRCTPTWAPGHCKVLVADVQPYTSLSFASLLLRTASVVYIRIHTLPAHHLQFVML